MPLPTLLLHHYTSGSGLIGIFESKQVWASDIHSLNDSKEFSHAIDICRTAINEELETCNDEKTKELLVRAIDETLESISKLAIFVACFSTVGDSLSQWRGYCPPAFGYSIGFDGEALRQIASLQGFQLNRCIYDDAEQKSTAKKWAQRTVTRILSDLSTGTDLSECVSKNRGQFLNEFIEFAPLLKDHAFKDENEWRLVGLVNLADPRMGVRVGKSMLIRYLPIDLKLNREDLLIWDIRVGPTPHPGLASSAVGHYFNKYRIENGVCISQIPYRDW